MPRHIDAWMDRVALSSVGPILISQVHEDPATLEVLNADRAGRAGQLVVSRRRQSLKVALECQIRELFDLGYRARVAEQLAAWAQGSFLELSNHPGRRLSVYCSSEPSLGEARDYTSALRVELTADTVPYWEDITPERLTLSGTTMAGTIMVPGTAPAPVCAEITPTGGTLTGCTIIAGGQTIELSGLSVAQGNTLTIDRDVRDDIRIRVGTVSHLSARSAASADDLVVLPGPRGVMITTNTAANAVVTVRGRWL